MDEAYGWELILDIHNCNPEKFNRKDIGTFLTELCDLIEMEKEDLHFWDYEEEPEEYAKAPPHLKGTSAVQFIKTSTIIIHTLEILKRIYLNVFSCKSFDPDLASDFITKYFEGDIKGANFIKRI